MKLWKFCLYTLLGAGLWNTFLAWVGFKLMQNWNTVIKYSETIDLAVLAVIVVGGGWVVWRHVKKSK
jgi:membrane protein DedA with SNARE-associated domain